MAVVNTNEQMLPLETARAIVYMPFVGWIAAIVLFIVYKDREVKWNAVQALMVAGFSAAIITIISYMPILRIFAPLLWVATLILQLVLAVKAYQGNGWRLPILAEWTDKVMKETVKK